MNLPFYPHGSFGLETSLALAVLIGIGFGFTLERGGFGSSRRLAAQFYLYDMTVFKVMFTAIVTAMLGLFGLARLGLVDLEAVWINPTFLWPQIVGGFLLGVGFIISGYCPGTAIVASASGKIDGMLALTGVGLGVFAYGAAYTPAVDAFQKSGSQGRLLLSDLLHVPPAWLAVAVALAAGSAFVGAEAVEKRFRGRAAPGREPRPSVRTRNAVVATLLAAGLVLALLPAAAPRARALAPLAQEVAPLELARHLAAGTEGWTVLDLRAPEEIRKHPMPGATSLPPEELARSATWEEKLSPHRFYVLVDEEGSVSCAVPSGYRAAALRGGFEGWRAEILSEPKPPAGGDAEALERYREKAAFFSYFTGAAAAAPAVAAPPPPAAGGGVRKKPGGGC